MEGETDRSSIKTPSSDSSRCNFRRFRKPCLVLLAPLAERSTQGRGTHTDQPRTKRPVVALGKWLPAVEREEMLERAGSLWFP